MTASTTSGSRGGACPAASAARLVASNCWSARAISSGVHSSATRRVGVGHGSGRSAVAERLHGHSGDTQSLQALVYDGQPVTLVRCEAVVGQERAGERAQPLVGVAVLEGMVLVTAEGATVDNRAQRLVRGGGALLDLVAVVLVVANQVIPEVIAYHLQQLVIAGADQGMRSGHIEQVDTQRRTHGTKLSDAGDAPANTPAAHRHVGKPCACPDAGVVSCRVTGAGTPGQRGLRPA